MVKAIYHEYLMLSQEGIPMFGKEVWGWRALALLLVMLLVPTIPELDTLQDEWQESISASQETDAADSNNEANDDDFATEEAAPLESESQEGDANAAEDSTDDSEDQPPELAKESAEKDEESHSASPPSGAQSEWILPATQVIVLSMMAIMAVGLLTSTATAIFASEAARFSILLAALGPLIAVTQRGEKGAFTRGRILGFVEAHPGIHFSALRDALQLGNGVTAHHIQILEKEGRIISWMDSRVRRFASSGVDQKRLKEIQSPVTGMQIAILQILSENETIGIKSGDLRIKLETSRQLLSYHMKQLSEKDFIKSTGKGRATRWSLLERGKAQLANSSHLILTSND